MDLKQLVTTVAFEPIEEVVLDDLHGDGGSALLRSFGCEVRQCRSHKAPHVHAIMGEELLVFDNQERLNYLLRHFRVRNWLGVLKLVKRDLGAR